jgi:hypothetical protein
MTPKCPIKFQLVQALSARRKASDLFSPRRSIDTFPPRERIQQAVENVHIAKRPLARRYLVGALTQWSSIAFLAAIMFYRPNHSRGRTMSGLFGSFFTSSGWGKVFAIQMRTRDPSCKMSAQAISESPTNHISRFLRCYSDECEQHQNIAAAVGKPS